MFPQNLQTIQKNFIDALYLQVVIQIQIVDLIYLHNIWYHGFCFLHRKLSVHSLPIK